MQGNMARQIFAAEISFQDTPPVIREKFAHSEKNIKRLLLTFRRRVDEVFIFSNRQRFTVYVVHESLKPLMDFFHEEHNLKGYVQYYYNSGESVTHLMATVSGLLSPVKGERQVISEFNRCFKWASASGTVGMTLDNAVRRALVTGETVRSETGIDQFCSSVVETGVELLYNRFQDIHQMNMIVVGTGNLAAAALDCLTAEGIHRIAVTGQDAEAAQRLARQHGIQAIELKLLPEHFLEADVVIGVAHDALEKQLLPALNDEGLRDRGRIILDFGIPPNFDPEIIGMLAEEYYNLDDLRRLDPSPLESFGGVEAAWRSVLRAANDFSLLLQLLHHSPVLNAYLTRQFALRNADWKIKSRRSIRSMFSFGRKDQNITGTAFVESKANMKVQLNNHVAENAAEVVRDVQTVKRLRYWFFDN